RLPHSKPTRCWFALPVAAPRRSNPLRRDRRLRGTTNPPASASFCRRQGLRFLLHVLGLHLSHLLRPEPCSRRGSLLGCQGIQVDPTRTEPGFGRLDVLGSGPAMLAVALLEDSQELAYVLQGFQGDPEVSSTHALVVDPLESKDDPVSGQ